MRYSISFLLLLVLAGLSGTYAQSGIVGTPGQVPRADVIDLKNTEVGLMPTMANEREIHSPVAQAQREEMLAIKARKARILDELSNNPVAVSRNNVPEPLAVSGFEANEPEGVPNDNDFALSPNGYIVSATNSIVRIYDLNGRELLRRSLTALGGAADTISRAFDPRVIYDQDHDRFIVVYDNGSSAEPPRNDLVLCFSQTGDPTGLWNTYAVKGNLRPTGTNVWMDYPQVAISKDELFMTGNLFPADGNNLGVGIWQCELADGYNGDPLDFVTYTDQGIFSLTPIQGVPDLYGPNMMFITKARGSGRSFGLYEVSNTIASGQASFSRLGSFTARDGYDFSPNCRQPGSSAQDGSDRLSTGDGRIQSAIRVNDNLYWVIGSDVGGRPGVYVGKISLSPLGPSFYSIQTTTFASADLDIGYPSITYAGQSVQDGNQTKEDLYIGFNFASPSKFPGIGCYYVSVDMEPSDPIIGVEGRGNLRLTGDADDPRNRWGDYTDVFYRGNPGEAFVVGYYTTPNGRNSTWISQFFVSAPLSTEQELPGVEGLKAYPNPAIDLIYFDFEVETAGAYEAYITDNQGRRVETLRKENLRPGGVSLSFNTAALAAGRYYVVVEGKGTKVLAKPFVVQQ